MKKLLVIVMAFGFTFCVLSANVTQDQKNKSASSDTTGTQRNKSKKQLPKQKLKEHKSAKEEMGQRKLDSLNRELYTPLLRLKDSTQNNSH